MGRPDFRRAFRLDRGREGVAARVDEEMEFHLARRAEELVAQGMSPREAREAAVRAFGDVARFRRELTSMGEARATRRGVAEWFGGLASDARLAARSLRRDALFSTMSLLTLAVGIGATKAVFSVVDGVLLRPLPYPEPARLVHLQELSEKGQPMDWAGANFYEARERTRTMRAMAAYGGGRTTVLGADEPLRATAYAVSGDFFRVLGVGAALGRTFTPEEGVAGGAPAVIVSHSFWERALGGDSAVDRRSLRLWGQSYRVVGVMPRGFAFPADAELWAAGYDDNPHRTAHNWSAVGRIADGATLDRARADLGAILADIRRREGAASGPSGSDAVGVYLTPLHQELTGDARRSLLVLQGAVAFVLLLACVNLTNASLARGETRQRELAVRAALGAGRGRLARLLLAESLLLAIAGGCLGLALAWWLTRFAASGVGTSLPGFARLRVDGTVVAFCSGVALLTGVVIGLLPARDAARTDLRGAMTDGGQATSGGSKLRARSVLVAAEVALAVTLLVGAGLLVRSMGALLAVDPGFAVDPVLTASISLPTDRYGDTTRIAGFYDALLPKLAAIPGVSAVGVVNVAPLAAADPSSQFYADGGTELVGSAGYRVVSPEYFRAMAIPLRAGRGFGEGDRAGAPHAVLVNESAARRFWPGGGAIGHRVRFPGMDRHGAEWLTVVGVVGDVHHRGLEEKAAPEMFVSYRQRPERLGEQGTIVVRGATPPEMLATALRGVIRAADPDVAVSLSSMRAALDRSVAPRRFTTVVLVGFGALALFLAAVGIYGVLAYSVARRRRELSVRLALGGQPSDLRRMVVADALRAVVPGMVVGVLVSLALSRSLRAMVYGVSALDPASFAVVVVLLLTVALLAAYLPARSATRVDPLLAMRGD